MRLLSDADLNAIGINYSRQHKRRLIAEGKFPAPIKLGEGRGRIAWLESEIEDWLKSRPRATHPKRCRRPSSEAA